MEVYLNQRRNRLQLMMVQLQLNQQQTSCNMVIARLQLEKQTKQSLLDHREDEQIFMERCPGQLYMSRPSPLLSNYRSPVQGLYLCAVGHTQGCGAHPGGGVMGAPGRIASRMAIHDFRRMK
ncbi:hypothetical protein ScPMuIL_000201 [Solemya velum]